MFLFGDSENCIIFVPVITTTITAMTEVQFRKLKGEVIAVFPYIISDGTNVLSYQHVGQHGSCAWDINNFTTAAKPEEYKPLLAELQSIYNDVELKVIQRRNHCKYLKALKTK